VSSAASNLPTLPLIPNIVCMIFYFKSDFSTDFHGLTRI
jgi:hypothetical protein